jgi:hypothetical protein
MHTISATPATDAAQGNSEFKPSAHVAEARVWGWPPGCPPCDGSQDDALDVSTRVRNMPRRV